MYVSVWSRPAWCPTGVGRDRGVCTAVKLWEKHVLEETLLILMYESQSRMDDRPPFRSERGSTKKAKKVLRSKKRLTALPWI